MDETRFELFGRSGERARGDRQDAERRGDEGIDAEQHQDRHEDDRSAEAAETHRPRP